LHFTCRSHRTYPVIMLFVERHLAPGYVSGISVSNCKVLSTRLLSSQVGVQRSISPVMDTVGTILRCAKNSLDLINRIDAQHGFRISQNARSSSYVLISSIIHQALQGPRPSLRDCQHSTCSCRAGSIRGSCRRGGSWCAEHSTY
jgi:hypothetical protein